MTDYVHTYVHMQIVIGAVHTGCRGSVGLLGLDIIVNFAVLFSSVGE